ncbi:MAG: hypothetical protein C4589_12510 [Peptococcaceae bacterium]|nr:MAG: hypothetical protein C4589_12510 [Peptococcaceae bacterium]
MFICKSCGGNVIGYRSSSRHWRKYICGPSRYKGKAVCPDKFLVDQDWLERTILAEIHSRYTTPDRIEQIIKEIQEDIKTGFREYNGAIQESTKERNKYETQKQRLLDAVKAGINPSIIANEVNNLQEQMTELDAKIKHLKDNPPSQLSFDEEEIKRFFSSFVSAFNNATLAERKKLIRTFVKQLELDPQNKEVRVSFYSDQVVQSIGVGDGT